MSKRNLHYINKDQTEKPMQRRSSSVLEAVMGGGGVDGNKDSKKKLEADDYNSSSPHLKSCKACNLPTLNNQRLSEVKLQFYMGQDKIRDSLKDYPLPEAGFS